MYQLLSRGQSGLALFCTEKDPVLRPGSVVLALWNGMAEKQPLKRKRKGADTVENQVLFIPFMFFSQVILKMETGGSVRHPMAQGVRGKCEISEKVPADTHD